MRSCGAQRPVDAFARHAPLLARVRAEARTWAELDRTLEELSRTGAVDDRIAHLDHQVAELSLATATKAPPMPSARAPTDSTACPHARDAPSAVTRTKHRYVQGEADRTVWAGGRRRQQCIAVRSRSARRRAVQPRAQSGTEQCLRPSQQAR